MTIFGNNRNNAFLVEGDDLQGLAGDDTYIVTNALANSAEQFGRVLVITDTEGSNRLQLADGLAIANLQFLGGNALQVTLTNNLRIQVVGADRFSFDIGGNAATPDNTGLIGRSFGQLANDFGVVLQNGSGSTTNTVVIGTGANPLGGAPNPPPSPVFVLESTGNTVQEGAAVGLGFTVRALTPVTVDTLVTFTVRPGNLNAPNTGTASTNAADFAPGAINPVQVVIPAGGSTANFILPTPLADALTEQDEAFTVEAAVAGNTLQSTATVLDATVGFQTVQLTGNVTGVNGVAESFVFSYQLVGGRATNVVGGNEYRITNFNPNEDRLVFDNIGNNTSLTEAQVMAIPGVSISENPFDVSTLLLVDPINGVGGGVVLVGLVDAALNTVTLIGT